MSKGHKQMQMVIGPILYTNLISQENISFQYNLGRALLDKDPCR